MTLADQAVTRPEPPVDRRAAQAELGGDRLHVDPAAAREGVAREREHVVAIGGGRPPVRRA